MVAPNLTLAQFRKSLEVFAEEANEFKDVNDLNAFLLKNRERKLELKRQAEQLGKKFHLEATRAQEQVREKIAAQERQRQVGTEAT